ncbi:hypothetical protein ACLKA6_018883 [Drosophila palustris]
MELTAAHGSYNASNRNDLSRSCSCAGAAMQASAVGRLPALNASTESGSEIEVWRTVQRKMTDSVVVTGAGAWNRLAVTADCGVAAWRLTENIKTEVRINFGRHCRLADSVLADM